MLDNGPNFTVATFIRRGPSKRRRGGQLRTLEKYTSNELQILRGGALCSLDRKQGYIVPSALTSQYMLPILERISSLYSQSKTQLLFMETVLRHATERADASTLRQVKNLLCDSLACYTALNEQCAKLYSAPSPGEAFPDHAARLMAASVLYITSNIGVPITVLVVDAADPLASHCAVLGLASLSIAEYIHQQVATRALPPAIEAETQELLAHYLSCLAAPASMEQAEYPAHLTAQEAERGLASGALCVGTLATYRHDNSEGEVEVTARVAGAPALVLLSGRLRLNRALDGDEVVLRVLPRDQWTALSSRVLTEEAGEDARGASPPRGTALDVPFGEVVAIRRRAPRQIIATLPLQRRSVGEEADDTDREEHLLVAPVDRRLPKIRIRTRQRRALEHQRFLVEIDSWQRESRFPHGHFVRILGDRRDWRVEVECLLLEHSITPRPFSTAALAHLPNIPGYDPATRGPHQWVDSNYALPADRLAGRRDMRRSHFVFSVDPPGCQDIDDAMSLQWLSPGRIEVAVHIADVCAFVPHNSALDLEARERATTVYLTHERYDMLPSLISSDIASLHGDKDRFTVSVAWEIAVTHADGSPVLDTEDFLALDEARNIRFNMPELPTWCGRGIIHSEVAATYQQAHNLIYDIAPDPAEDKVPLGQAGRAIPRHKWRRLRQDLRGLMVFSRSLLRARESNGALDLSQGAGAELKFKVDAEGSPVQVQGKEELEIHHTISELMIVANSAVASIIYAAEPLHTLLRIHPPPSTEKLKLLQAQILETGLDIFQQSSSTAEVREGLRSYREKMSRQKSAVQDPEQAVELLTSVVIRAMNEAKYVGSSALSGELLVASMSDAAAEGKYIGHYGLGLRFYTHFTSPIRRYADVIVHRQLLSVLASKATAQIVPAPPEPMKAATPVKPATTDDDLDFLDSLLDGVGDELVVPAPPAPESESTIESARTTTKNTPFTDSELFKISEHLNTMNRRAKACQFGCQKLFLCLYFTNRVEQHRALIFALRENGFMAFLPTFNYKGPVYLRQRGSSSGSEEFDCEARWQGDRIVELVVRKNDTSSRPFTLAPMQQVWLSVSYDESKYSRELYLHYEGLVDGSKTQASPATNEYQAFIDQVTSPRKEQAAPPAVAPEAAVSLAAVIRNETSAKRARWASEENFTLGCKFYDLQLVVTLPAATPASDKAKTKMRKMVAQVAPLRHAVRGCGRMMFGTVDDIRPLFEKTEDISYEEKEERKMKAVHVQLSAGHAGAKARMEKWGEEWAEEEDLPSQGGEWTGPVSSSAPAGALNAKYAKEVAISSQRLGKLKVAKRKSKYDG